jgi:spermidine synthase
MATRFPYMKMMLEQMAPWCTQQSSPSRVLVIGLGGGELPQHLLHECPGMSLETVELNAQVIEMGRKYFGLREAEERFGSRLAIEETDALTGVKERVVSAPGRFDAVLVDCFGSGGEVPEDCRSRNFLAGVHELLRPRGVLLQNIWDWSIEKPEVVANAFWETTDTYQTVFGKSAFEDLQGPDVVHVLKATKAQASAALETDASEDVSDD